MAKAPNSKKVANSLVAVGAAAVMAVYAAGYSKTRSAADKFDAESAGRRPAVPDAVRVPVAAAPANPAAVPDAPLSQTATISKPASSPVASSAPAAPVANDAVAVTPAETAPAPTPVMVASVAPPAAAVAPPAAEPAAKWKDGTYTGWGTCRHGDIQAQVVIEGGRIQNASIAQCLTRYSCSVIGRLLPEVAERQSAEVDYVSGATQSANAFYYAVLDALAKAK
jgi:uncharacterized protein with FMN-binding domain